MQNQMIVDSEVDNYMLIDRDYEQQAPAEHHRCLCCGRDFLQSELTAYGNDTVCEGCEADYLLKAGEDMHTSFLLENLKDFSYAWFYKWLQQEERDKALFALFLAALSSNGKEMSEFKMEYCRDNDGFLEFVAARIGK